MYDSLSRNGTHFIGLYVCYMRRVKNMGFWKSGYKEELAITLLSVALIAKEESLLSSEE